MYMCVFTLIVLIPVEEMAKLYREKGIIEPANAMWAYYYSKRNTEKANEMWSLMGPSERILYQPVLHEIRQNNDVALGWELLKLMKSEGVSHSQQAPIIAAIINVESMLIQLTIFSFMFVLKVTHNVILKYTRRKHLLRILPSDRQFALA